jgi:membrane protein
LTDAAEEVSDIGVMYPVHLSIATARTSSSSSTQFGNILKSRWAIFGFLSKGVDRMPPDRKGEADAPWQMPARDWMDILRRTWKDTCKKNLSLVAAGVTYYLLLALFPALAALVSVWDLVARPADVTKSVQSLSGILSPSTVRLISTELHQLVSASSKSLGLGAVISIVIALYSGVRGMTGMMAALNIAYDQPEGRGYIKFYATALLLTVAVIVGGLIALTLVAGLPAVLHDAGMRGHGRWVGLIVEWPLLIVFAIGMVALIYRYGPDGSKPQWKWTSLGVVTATILWIAGSILFSVYVYYFGNYNKIYGSLGMPLVLLTWMWLSVYVVLFGAEIDGEAERQTQRNTMANLQLQARKQEAKDTDTAARRPPPSL